MPVQRTGFRVWGLGCRVKGLGLEFRVEGWGFGVVPGNVRRTNFLRGGTRSDSNALRRWFVTPYPSGRHGVDASLSGPVDLSFRALSGRLQFTFRRHKLHKKSILMLDGTSAGAPPLTVRLASPQLAMPAWQSPYRGEPPPLRTLQQDYA